MHRSNLPTKLGRSLWVVLAIAATGPFNSAWRTEAAEEGQKQGVTNEILLDSQNRPDLWVQYGRNYAGWRFAPMDEINRETVGRLKPVWTHETGIPDGAFEVTALVFGGKMYLTTPQSHLICVDPRTGDLLIVTKELQAPESFVFLAPGPFQAGTTATLELVTTIDFAALPSSVQPPADASPLVLGVPHLPTAGDVSVAGDLVLIRTYGTAWLWERPENTALGDAFAGNPCEAPSAIEEQGEAIAFTGDGSGYVTISEGTTPTVNLFTAE